MILSPEQARILLPGVDPARLRAGWPVGLRDGAIMALAAAGLSAGEIARLQATAITMARGILWVTVQRNGVTWHAELPADLGGRLLAWLSERRLWASAKPVFIRPKGPITPKCIYRILERRRCEGGPDLD